MDLPPRSVLVAMGVVATGLVLLHVVATRGEGVLRDPAKELLAVSPATTLSTWWHHLWAGFFHHTWGHLAYNLVVFLVAFPFACRQMGPALTLANAYWIGPFIVFSLHLLLVLPLARLGVPYAVGALDYPLVGFSVMAYSLVGAAVSRLDAPAVAAVAVALVGFEVVLAVLVTGPFIFAYHVGGFALGWWVRTLLVQGHAAPA